jgi:WD40 repeat protein/Mrp family chromosome partitioning ATPase
MIVTFYSFKGGVGRSMAMAAAAYLLAQRGLKVLVIDFDLEAPGLERYFFDEPSSLATVRANHGLMDFVLAYKRALTSDEEFKRADFKDWSRYIVDAIPRTPSGGSVDMMTAGCRYPQERYAEYALFVRTFAWQDFFHNWRGDRFFEWLRRELTSGPSSYDVVLVDSRTGVTEMGGVCAYQLADAAVLLCAPNYQNLDGTRAVLDDFRSDAVTALRLGRPLEIVVVPARVEPTDTAKRDQFFADLERTFGSDGLPRILADAGLDYRGLSIPYDRDLAIIERLVDETTIHDGPLASHSAARAAFERLADVVLLVGSVGDDRWKTQREEAFARLAGADRAPTSLPIADLSKRGSGYDAFLFAGASDTEDASRLRAALLDRGLNVWTMDNLSPGEAFESTIGRALQYSEGLLIGLGRSSPTDALWATLRKAKERRKLIVPVLLPGCVDPPGALQQVGLSDLHAVDAREFPHEAADRIVDALSRRGLQASQAAAVVDPYPGAAAYSEDQASYFFGRDADTDRLEAALSDHPIVMLSGAASIGKTSLVHAGLLPRLRAHGIPSLGSDAAWSVVVADLTQGDPDGALNRAAEARADGPLLIVIDGIDETGDQRSFELRAQRGGRIGEIIRTAAPHRRVLLVWRATSSYVSYERRFSEWFGESAVHEVTLAPMDAAALRAAIEKPAARAGHLFEPGLVDRIVQDAGTQPGAIAQIQRTLQEIWTARRRGWLTNKAYDAGGGLAGRFGQRLEKFLAGLNEGERGAIEMILRALVQFDARLGVVPIHRSWTSITSTALMEQQDALALRERLLRERLIDLWLADEPPQPTVFGPEGRWACALALPAVPGAVERLAQADARFLLWRQRFSSYVYGFVQSGRPATYTVPADALHEAEEWWTARKEELSSEERQVIESSFRARESAQHVEQAREMERLESERVRQERDRADAERAKAVAAYDVSRKRTRIAVVLAVVAAVLVGIVAWETMRLRRQLEAEQRQLAAESFHQGAEQFTSGQPAESLAFLAQSLRLDPSHVPARTLALSLIVNGRWPQRTLRADTPIDALAWSPDGTSIIGSSATGGFTVFTAGADGTTQPTFVPEAITIGDPWSPDGRRYVTSAGGSLQLWDAATRRTLGAAFKPEGRVLTLAWNPDGTQLAAGTEAGAIHIWDGTTERQRLRHNSRIAAMAWDPAGQRLVSSAYENDSSSVNELRIWDTAGGTLAGQAKIAHPIRILAWMRDGGVAGMADDGTGVEWTLKSAPEAREHGFGRVTAAAWSEALGMFAAAFESGSVVAWQPGSDPGFIHDNRDAPTTQLSFSPSGLMLALSSKDSVFLMQTRTFSAAGEPFRHRSAVTALAWSRDGKWLTTADADRQLQIWAAGLTRPAAILLPHDGNAVSAAWSPVEGRAVTGSWDHTARLWDTSSGNPLAVLLHEASVVSTKWSADGNRVFTSSADGITRVWDRATGKIQLELKDKPFTTARWTIDGTALATAGEDFKVRIWRAIAAGKAPDLVLDHPVTVTRLAWTADGRWLATVDDLGMTRAWNVSAQAQPAPPLSRASASETGVVALEWNPDGARLATAADREATIWNAASRTVVKSFPHSQRVRSLAWSPDGAFLATASDDKSARVWSAETGRQIGAPMMHDQAVSQVVWSPEGRRLATASLGNRTRVWDPALGVPLTPPMAHQGVVTEMVWAPDGQRLMTASSEHAVRVWDVPTGTPADAAALADFAEALGGRRIEFRDDGSHKKVATVIDTDDAVDRLARVRGMMQGRSGATGVEKTLQWFVTDPYSRAVSPLSSATVPDYARRLQSLAGDWVDELAFTFPGLARAR